MPASTARLDSGRGSRGGCHGGDARQTSVCDLEFIAELSDLTKADQGRKSSTTFLSFQTFQASQIPVLLPHQVREHPICDALKSNKVKTIKRKENAKEMLLKALCYNSLGFHRGHTHSEAPFLGRIQRCTPKQQQQNELV